MCTPIKRIAAGSEKDSTNTITVPARVLYLIQWKACWTPESYIIDKDRIPASLEADKDRNRRRSIRFGEFVRRQEEGI